MDRAPHHTLSLSRKFPLYHPISICNWLGITGSFSRGRSMFASLIFVTFVMNRQVEIGGSSSSVVFGKGSKITKTRRIRSGMQIETAPIVLLFLCSENEIKAWKGFFQEFIIFKYERAEHNTGLSVWCFPFLFSPLDKRTYLSHKNLADWTESSSRRSKEQKNLWVFLKPILHWRFCFPGFLCVIFEVHLSMQLCSLCSNIFVEDSLVWG